MFVNLYKKSRTWTEVTKSWKMQSNPKKKLKNYTAMLLGHKYVSYSLSCTFLHWFPGITDALHTYWLEVPQAIVIVF